MTTTRGSVYRLSGLFWFDVFLDLSHDFHTSHDTCCPHSHVTFHTRATRCDLKGSGPQEKMRATNVVSYDAVIIFVLFIATVDEFTKADRGNVL